MTRLFLRPFHDGGLADAGLADQDGVVLGATRQYLDDPSYFLVAPDHRIELPLRGERGEVAAELLERLIRRLGILAGDALVAADAAQRLHQLLATEPDLLEGAADGTRLVEHGEQQVLDADVLVLQLRGFVLGFAEQLGEALGGVRGGPRAGAGDLRYALELALDALAEIGDGYAGALQEHRRDTVGLREQGGEQVLDVHTLVVTTDRESLRVTQRFLRLLGESFDVHGSRRGNHQSGPRKMSRAKTSWATARPDERPNAG